MLLSYKDYRSPEKLKQLKLSGPELIRRVLLHGVPRGFQRIRCYGFMAGRLRKASLALCRHAYWLSVHCRPSQKRGCPMLLGLSPSS